MKPQTVSHFGLNFRRSLSDSDAPPLRGVSPGKFAVRCRYPAIDKTRWQGAQRPSGPLTGALARCRPMGQRVILDARANPSLSRAITAQEGNNYPQEKNNSRLRCVGCQWSNGVDISTTQVWFLVATPPELCPFACHPDRRDFSRPPFPLTSPETYIVYPSTAPLQGPSSLFETSDQHNSSRYRDGPALALEIEAVASEVLP